MAKLTYCVVKGARLWKQSGSKWHVAHAHSPKAVCGTLVRVTSIGGDVRNTQPIAIMKARGHEFGVHPRDLQPSRSTRMKLKAQGY